MTKSLLRSLLPFASLLIVVLFSPDHAAAQFMPFGFAGETWNSPAHWSGCGSCLPSTPEVVWVDRVSQVDCCEPARPVPNSPVCKPGCAPCKSGDESTTMKQTPIRMNVGGNREVAKRETKNLSRQYFGVEYVVPAKRKPHPGAQPVSRDVTKQFDEKDGWITVSPAKVRLQDRHLGSTR